MSIYDDVAGVTQSVEDASGHVLTADQDSHGVWVIGKHWPTTDADLLESSDFGYDMWELNYWLNQHYPRAFPRIDDSEDPNGDLLRERFVFSPDFPVGVIQQCIYEGCTALGLIDKHFADHEDGLRPQFREGQECETVLEDLSTIRFLRYSCLTELCGDYYHCPLAENPVAYPEFSNRPSKVTCGHCEGPIEEFVVYDASHLAPFFYPLTGVSKGDLYDLLNELNKKGRLPGAGPEHGGDRIFVDGDDLRTITMELIRRRDIPLHIARRFLIALNHEFDKVKSEFASVLD